MAYVLFGKLPEALRAEVRALRPEWDEEKLNKFEFWVCANGHISRRAGHHSLTQAEFLKVIRLAAVGAPPPKDMRGSFKSTTFTMCSG